MKHGKSRTGAWTTRRFLALLGTIVLWAIAAIDLFYIWPASLGGNTSFVVVSGSSMEPTYYTGDLVFARDIEPSVGDIIVYSPESLDGAQIVHRIIGGNADDGWVMQGDNNSFIDPFEPTGDEVLGVVLVHYPNVGRVTAVLLNPVFWAALVLAAIVMLVWSSGDKDDDDDEDDDESEADADAVYELLAPPQHTPSALTLAGAPLRAMAVFAVATWLLGAGISPAAASTMSVSRADEVKAYTLNACGNPTPTWGSTTTATGATSTQVTLSNIPAGCLNRVFTLSVRNAAGTQLATLTGTPTTASFSFTMPSGNYTVSQVATVIVKVTGWVFPTTWTATPAWSCIAVRPNGNTSPLYGCTVSITPNGSPPWDYDNGSQMWNYSFTVTWTTTPPNNNWKWRVTFNHAAAPFPGFTPHWVGMSSNPGVALAPGYSCTQQPIMTVQSANRNVWGAGFDIGDGGAPTWFTGTSLCS